MTRRPVATLGALILLSGLLGGVLPARGWLHPEAVHAANVASSGWWDGYSDGKGTAGGYAYTSWNSNTTNFPSSTFTISVPTDFNYMGYQDSRVNFVLVLRPLMNVSCCGSSFLDSFSTE